MDREINKCRCCAALRAIMQYREVSMADIANGTGIPYGTVANYYYGRNSLPGSVAYNVVEIEHFLDIDGRILTGSMSIDQFYEEESNRIGSTIDTPEIDAKMGMMFNQMYFRRNPEAERLKRMMEYYKRLMVEMTNGSIQEQETK